MLKNPLRDIQDDPPVGYCPECGGEIWLNPNQGPYHLYGRLVCVECFGKEISYRLKNDPDGLARDLGIDVGWVS